MRATRYGWLIICICLTLAGTSSVQAQSSDAAGDAVVIAVIDERLSPYHWDFHAEHMPQAVDADPANDLPLDAAPHTWLPGFPDPAAFDGYRSVALTLDGEDASRDVALLTNDDVDAWSTVAPSNRSHVEYHWLPGTKIIGVLDFAGNGVRGGNDAHGTHVASVSAGSLHGTCPECLLVFVAADLSTPPQAEAALEWVLAQPWIDLVVNSYGFNRTARYRDRIYSGSDTVAQRVASERGQTIFFSAGNGLENDFRWPNSTYFSSQEGPDWTITVGAVAPSGHNYTGSGKPADVAAPGAGYPASGGTTVAGTGTFGGTSNATPVIGGIYAAALSWTRQQLVGQSRVQSGGVIAAGGGVECGSARPDCELSDGVVTARELRTRVLHGAVRTPEGAQLGDDTSMRPPAEPQEAELLAEGHGTFFARSRPATWSEELGRIIHPLAGTAAAPVRPEGEREWFIADSYCRQQIWGTWSGGDWATGTPTPDPSPLWPWRTTATATCAALMPVPEGVS